MSTLKKSFELLPPEGNHDVGKKVFWVLGEVLKYKDSQGLPKKWVKSYDLCRNKHWKQKHTTKPLVSANLIGTHRRRTVNMLTNNNPTFNVARFSPDVSEEQLEMVLHAQENWWIEQEQQSILEDSVLNGETYGCAIEKVVFNPELEYGIGEVETEVLEPFHFGLYPVLQKDVQKCEAVLHFRPMTVREARRLWPKSADKIRSDKEYIAKLKDTRHEIAKRGEDFFGTIGGVVKHFINSVGDTSDHEDETLVVEFWVKDRTEVTEMGEEVDGLVEMITKPKYAGYIRRVIVCNGGDVVLEDRSNPSINPDLPEELAQQSYLWDKFPFSLTTSNKDNVSPWGSTDIEQLDGLQAEINKTLSQFTLLKDRASRMKIINPKTSGVSNDQFTNAPGIVNPSNSMEAAAIRYMAPPEIPRDMLEGLRLYKDLFYSVSGAFELENAQTPGREVISYKAISALIEHAKTTEQGKIRNYGKMIRERGRMYLSLAQNWYTEQRWISYQVDDKRQSQGISGLDLLVPAKLTVVSGSTMPRSKVQEREEAIALADKRHIDSEALLKVLEFSDRKEIIKRQKTGPLGYLAEALGAMGASDTFTQYVMELGQSDPDEVERAIESGQFPPLESILGQPQPNASEQIETEKIAAEIEKTRAETMLVQEKIRSERVDQQVRSAGVTLDSENLRINKFRAVTESKKRPEGKSAERTNQGPYRERGMESNNMES
jgi:hypothetical protein